MRKMLINILCLMPVVSYGRLGETEAQLQQRFGPPTSQSKDMIMSQGKIFELCPILTFKQDDWYIHSHIVEGRCALEAVSKPGEWTDAQITLVLTSNAQSAKWTEITNPSLRKLRREWRREDGATAIWQLGQGFVVTHPAYNLAKQRAQDKAKANASRLPNL